MALNRRSRIAFVGAGPIGRQHLAAFRELDVDVVGLCTGDTAAGEHVARELHIPFHTSSVEELYERTSADAVVVAVPIAESHGVYRRVFSLPWISLVEKPLGLDLRDARDLERQASACGHRSFVGFNRRHLAATRLAAHRLESFSGPRTITVLDQQDRSKARMAGHPDRVVDNFMYANSIHLIDYFSYFGRGDVRSVDVSRPWTAVEGCSVEASIRFDSGDIGVYRGVWEQAGPWSVAIVCDHHELRMQPLEVFTETPDSIGIHPDAGLMDDERFKPGFLRQAGEFIRGLDGETTCPSLREAVATTELVARIYGLAD